MSEITPKLPVNTRDFWRTRINTTLALEKPLHTVIFDTDDANWSRQQQQTNVILHKCIQPNQTVLDAGCGLGATWPCFPGRAIYRGVDISPDLIEIARLRYPHVAFDVGDLTQLSYEDKQFDIVVCRSLREMFYDNFGKEAWDPILSELRRVGRRVLLLEYGDPMSYEFVE